jgi:hypothetical protein
LNYVLNSTSSGGGWLASRDRRVRLQLIATLGNRAPNPSEGQVLLKVSNLGARRVVVTAMGSRVGIFPQWSPIFPRIYLPLYPNANQPGMEWPLEDGPSIDIAESFYPTVHDAAGCLTGPLWLHAWTVSLWVQTSVDVTRSARVKPRLRKRLLYIARGLPALRQQLR